MTPLRLGELLNQGHRPAYIPCDSPQKLHWLEGYGYLWVAMSDYTGAGWVLRRHNG